MDARGARAERGRAPGRARGDGRQTRAAHAASSAARVAVSADGIPRSPRLARAAIRGHILSARDALDPGSVRWLAFSTSRAIRCRRARAGSTRRRRRRRARDSIERRAWTRARSRDRLEAGVRRRGRCGRAHRRCSYLEGGAAAGHLLGRDRGDAGALEGGLVRADEGGLDSGHRHGNGSHCEVGCDLQVVRCVRVCRPRRTRGCTSGSRNGNRRKKTRREPERFPDSNSRGSQHARRDSWDKRNRPGGDREKRGVKRNFSRFGFFFGVWFSRRVRVQSRAGRITNAKRRTRRRDDSPCHRSSRGFARPTEIGAREAGRQTLRAAFPVSPVA